MVRRSVRLAAVALAAIAALPFDSFADSRLLQDTRRNAWAFLSERSPWGDDKIEALRILSPAGVPGSEISWLKSSDLKPGSGLQLDLEQGWALRADWDRYRPRAVQVRETVDTLLLGLQYTFR
jgi:hypothetical protein